LATASRVLTDRRIGWSARSYGKSWQLVAVAADR